MDMAWIAGIWPSLKIQESEVTMDKIIEQLVELAQVAPDVCQKRGDYFVIDRYLFFD